MEGMGIESMTVDQERSMSRTIRALRTVPGERAPGSVLMILRDGTFGWGTLTPEGVKAQAALPAGRPGQVLVQTSAGPAWQDMPMPRPFSLPLLPYRGDVSLNSGAVQVQVQPQPTLLSLTALLTLTNGLNTTIGSVNALLDGQKVITDRLNALQADMRATGYMARTA